MENNRLFELADELKALRERKDALEAELKQVNMDIDNVDWHLSNLMGETETQNFTRAGTMFFLSTKTRASAKAGQKDELFGALRANGYGDLITETINAGSLSSFVKEQIAENEDALLFAGKDIPMRVIPLSHLHAAAFTLLGFQRIIGRKRYNVVLNRSRRHLKRSCQLRHGNRTPCRQNSHDFCPALVHRHGRSPPFPWLWLHGNS